jgi:DNA-binding XRE family transcriptional regulator
MNPSGSPSKLRLTVAERVCYLKAVALKTSGPPNSAVMSEVEQKALGAAIRRARERNNLSQEEFAHRCGLHRTYIGSVERGERNVSLENIVRIAKTLGMTPADLLREAGL